MGGDKRHSRLISFTTKQNLHDFRYEGGAPINSGSQITPISEKRKYGIDLCFVGCQRLRASVLGQEESVILFLGAAI